jgi:hypothetical protein
MGNGQARKETMKMMNTSIALAALIIGGAAVAGESPAPKNAYLYIGWPNDGEVVRKNNFRVWFGLRNMGVAPAGTEKPMTGHHHLIVDAPLPPMDEEIPADKNHLHFGKGQTETRITLPSGTHTLQLLLGDLDHLPHNPPMVSQKKTITVK